MKCWYVARTQPHKEKLVQINLINQGIATFLPRIWRSHRRRGVFENKLCPLFPGFVFFESAQDPALWRAVGGTLGVSYVLWGGGRRPRPVPQSIMTDLFSSCVNEVLAIEEVNISVGDSVQMTRGPLSGLVGTIVSLEGTARAALLLDLMGGAKAQVHLVDLERLT